MAISRLCRALVLCSLVVACSKATNDGSQTDTLDNLVRGPGDALAINDCTGTTPMDQATFQSLRAKGLIEVSDALAETLRTTLADVKPVLDLYFGVGYKLAVKPDAKALCKASGPVCVVCTIAISAVPTGPAA